MKAAFDWFLVAFDGEDQVDRALTYIYKSSLRIVDS